MRPLVPALLLATIGAATAHAEYPPAPVCGRPAVLEQLTFELRRAGRSLSLEPASVGEVSNGALVHCAVRAHAIGYDTNDDGHLAIDTVAVIQYTLELRRNGIFLRVE